MIINSIFAEYRKLKHSPLWISFLILPIIPAIFGTLNYKLNISILQEQWYSLWSQHTLFLCFLFMPALIGTYCSYLWRLEHTNHNWNQLLTAPISPLAIFIGKLVQAASLTLLCNIWIFLLFYVSGKVIGLTTPLPTEIWSWLFCGLIGGIVVSSVQLFLSLVITSFAIPIGISIAGGVAGLVLMVKGLGLYFPYSLYSMGMRANNPQMVIDFPLFLVNSILLILLFSLLNIYGIKRKCR